MAQNPVPKRQNLASVATAAGAALIKAIEQLAECAAEQAAMGGDGNFQDSDFTGTSNPYLSGYNAGVLVSTVGPNATAFLNAFVSGNSGATNGQILRLCIPSPAV